MSTYKKVWRKYSREVEALALHSESDSDGVQKIGDYGGNRVGEQGEPQEQGVNSDHSNGCEDISVNVTDNESDNSSHTTQTEDVLVSESLDTCSSSSDLVSESDNTEVESYENESLEPDDIGEDLAGWSAKHQCTRAALNDILNILRKHGLRVPKDGRTLLQTPRQVLAVDKCGGKYIFMGIESGLLKVFAQNAGLFMQSKEAILSFNIDGVPLFKSSNLQLWPILCTVLNFEPFVVAMYCGDTKPNSVDDYLHDFLIELSYLKNNGVNFNEINIRVSVLAFICDAPARAFLKCIKGHTGYFGCERCTIKGKWRGRVVYESDDGTETLRSEVQFNGFNYKDHQLKKTPLIDAGISCIHSFALDYMHLVCLGVIKRMLLYWKQGPRECKLSRLQLTLLSDKLCAFYGKMPKDFARQPRSLDDLDRWKATELRQFGLYTGPIVLRNILSESHYKHFLCLTVAFSLMLDTNDEKCHGYSDYASQLMKYFVEKAGELYGETFTTYNVHSLIHLSEDIQHFQRSLNDICAFPYENFLQRLKKSVRNASNPIAQVAKRIAEMDKARIRRIPKPVDWFMSTKKKDSCFLLQNGSFSFVQQKRSEGQFVCNTLSQRNMESLFTDPCDSKLINICVVRKVTLRQHHRRKLLEKNEITRKVVCLPLGESYVLLPMLHGIERL